MESIESIDKYIPDFTNYLTGKAPINFRNYILLLNEQTINTSANPFICCLISFFIKNNINVILASGAESLHHYSNILKKCGLNLNNNEKFSCIDLFYTPIKPIIKEELPLSEVFPYTYNPNRSKFYHTNVTLTGEGGINFEILIENISKQIKKGKEDAKYIVIFDNISVLPNSSQNLIENFNRLVQFSHHNKIDMVMNMNKEISEGIYNYLYNISDLEIEFKPNESGFSKDIDGQIKVYLKTYNLKEWNLRYNIKDNGINFFPHLVI